MGKTEKTEDRKTDTGTPAPEKPKRGRRPKAAVKQAAPETGDEVEVAAVDSVTPKEPAGMPVTEESAAENNIETSGTEESPGTENTAEPSAPGTNPEGEDAPEVENAVENGAVESPVTNDTATEETPGQEPEEDTTLPATLPAASGQIIDSPLKQMKLEFQHRAQVIKEQMRNIQNSFIMISFQLHWIKENNMYRVLNYKNIYDYAEKEYGIKRTTCCNFICIIENYAERNENGEVIESIADCYRNYSASQLVAMLGMSDELKQQVTPDMSVRAIDRLRKESRQEAAAAVPETVPEEKTAVAETESVEAAPDKAVPENDIQNAAMPTANETETLEPGTVPSESKEPEDTRETETVNEGKAVAPARNADWETQHPEDAENEETDAAAALPENNAPVEDGTLAEIDSYSDYQSMADELDLIMRHVFSAQNPVRVKIVCVQG